LGGCLLLCDDRRGLAFGGFPLSRTLGCSAAPPTARFPLDRCALGSFLGSSSGDFCLDPAAMLLRVLLEALRPSLRGGLIRWRNDSLKASVSRRALLKRFPLLIRERPRPAYLRKRMGQRRWYL